MELFVRCPDCNGSGTISHRNKKGYLVDKRCPKQVPLTPDNCPGHEWVFRMFTSITHNPAICRYCGIQMEVTR